MLEIIDYSDIKRYKKYITSDINNSSYLYFDKDLIHKIFFHSSEEFESILKKLDKLKFEELVEIKNLIYKDGNIVGYSIKNYKQYKSLNRLKSRAFDLKKQDSIKLVNSYSNIVNNGLAYRDFHLGNILLNPSNGDIKICDLDSIDLFESWEDEKYALEDLLISVLTYLYNIKYAHIRNILSHNYLGKIINITEKDICIEYILEVINLIKYEQVESDKVEILNKSKELINKGYCKIY